MRGAIGQKGVRIKYQVWLHSSVVGISGLFDLVFLVVKDLVRPAILGVDWLAKVNAEIKLSDQSLKLEHGGRSLTVNFNLNTGCFSNDTKSECDVVGGPGHLRENLSNVDFVSNVNVMSTTVEGFVKIDISSHVASLEQLLLTAKQVVCLDEDNKDNLFKLLSQFQHLFNKYPGRTHKYQHVIKMRDITPFVKRAYPIPFRHRSAVDKVIQEMLGLGIIKREPSAYVSPLAVVTKKDGTVRVCLDARLLNSKMYADNDAPSSPEEIFQSLPPIRYMSTIDLRSSYWQIPLSPDSIQYVAFLYAGKTNIYFPSSSLWFEVSCGLIYSSFRRYPWNRAR